MNRCQFLLPNDGWSFSISQELSGIFFDQCLLFLNHNLLLLQHDKSKTPLFLCSGFAPPIIDWSVSLSREITRSHFRSKSISLCHLLVSRANLFWFRSCDPIEKLCSIFLILFIGRLVLLHSEIMPHFLFFSTILVSAQILSTNKGGRIVGRSSNHYCYCLPFYLSETLFLKIDNKYSSWNFWRCSASSMLAPSRPAAPRLGHSFLL